MTRFYNETGYANGSASQEDFLILDYSAFSIFYSGGIHLQQNGEQNIKSRANGQTILSFSSIELFNVTGTNGNDILVGGDYDRDAGFAANPYDDDQLFGGEGDDHIEGRGGDDLLVGGGGNDTLIGGEGMDELHGGSGNDKLYGGADDWLDDDSGTNHFYATEAARVTANDKTTLHADYSAYGGNGIRLSYYQGGGLIQNGIGGTLRFDGGLAFDIKGTAHNDVIGDDFNLSNNDTVFGNGGDDYINSGNGNDFITGDAGNDTLVGGAGQDKIYGGDGDDILNDTEGSLYGDAGFDTVVADYTNLSYGGRGINFTPAGTAQLYFNSVENFHIKGTQFADSLIGGIHNDVLDGGLGADVLEGRNGDDQLLATFGSDTLRGGNGDDVIYTVAGVDKATKELYGDDGADRFVLDVRGDVTLGFAFNTQTLANFVNAITLPEDPGYMDWQELGTDIAFATAGAVLGAVPGIGPGLEYLVSLAETGFGSYQEAEEIRAQITAQVEKANQAALDYADAEWGEITTSSARDVVIIRDFKIGIDSIMLPRLPDNAFYQIQDAANDGLNGVYVSIRQQVGSAGTSQEQLKSVVFIANNYNTGIGTGATFQMGDSEFESAIRDLLVGSQIGKFSKTPVTGDNNTATEILKGSFANDVVNAMGGSDEIFGYFGDDVLLGDEGNDLIYGGSNQNTAYLKYERGPGNPNGPYLDDGNDLISGGEGNDVLYGESGNDFINGDGFVRGAGNTTIAVGSGNDVLYGGTGNDTLQGGAGSDQLFGGTGNDELTGGIGLDFFVFDAAPGAGNMDTITDFVAADDTIRLENAIFTRLVTLGVLNSGMFKAGAGISTGTDANDYVIYNTTTGALYYDADGNGAAASQQIATLVGVPTLGASDFVVV